MSAATQELGLHCLASDTPMSDCTYAARGYEAHCERVGQKTMICRFERSSNERLPIWMRARSRGSEINWKIVPPPDEELRP
jgi:hypothetical protein